MRNLFGIATGILIAAVLPARAADPSTVPVQKRTELGLYLTAQEAAHMIAESGSKILFLDVRTRAEVTFVGMPTSVDANVPILIRPDFPVWDDEKATFRLEQNLDFIPEVKRRLAEKGLMPNDTIILTCRSGDRSALAADTLAAAGFTKVYTIVDGFEGDLAKDGRTAGQRTVNGWKNAGLPWSYKLDKAKMYGLDR